MVVKPTCFTSYLEKECSTCDVSPLCQYFTDGEAPGLKKQDFLVIALKTGWYTRDELLTLIQNAYRLKGEAAKKRYDAARRSLEAEGYVIKRHNKPEGGRGEMMAIRS